ncbi:hypothetical protein KIN20_036102 [Parelaphostrongylus tenuis]|uniref:Uncharacterized protein n=1 Tax=Parelaphostrongylus tenuis TaxID=148309 RepID=A0AAD5RC65_PARTN|nr:hypothetical protein KIN20_036102 [Parelaphostrongylus tenuis]
MIEANEGLKEANLSANSNGKKVATFSRSASIGTMTGVAFEKIATLKFKRLLAILLAHEFVELMIMVGKSSTKWCLPDNYF